MNARERAREACYMVGGVHFSDAHADAASDVWEPLLERVVSHVEYYFQFHNVTDNAGAQLQHFTREAREALGEG